MRVWLIDLRKKLNLTQQDVSEKAGVTRQMIAAIENGTANPSVETAKLIAEIFDISWTFFFDKQESGYKAVS